MGVGLAFGTGFAQKTQQRMDESRAEEAYGRLQDRALEDYKYKSEIDVDTEVQKTQKLEDVRVSAVDAEKARRRDIALETLPPEYNPKLREHFANVYSNDSNMTTLELMGLSEKFDITPEGTIMPRDRMRIDGSLARLGTVFEQYKGTTFYKFMENEIKYGDDLSVLMEKFSPQQTVGAGGKIDYRPVPVDIVRAGVMAGSSAGRVKGYESKAIKTAAEDEILVKTMGFTKVVIDEFGNTKFSQTTPEPVRDYLSKIESLATNIYLDSLGTEEVVSEREAVIRAKLQLEQVYGPIVNYEENLKSGTVRPIFGGSAKVTAAPSVMQADAQLSGEELVSKYGADKASFDAYVAALVQAVKEDPQMKGTAIDIISRMREVSQGQAQQ